MSKLTMNGKERKHLVVFKKLDDGDITKVQTSDRHLRCLVLLIDGSE